MSRREFCPVAACVADHGPPALPPVPAPARHARRAEPPSAGPGKLSCPACPALRQQTVDVDFAGGEITTNGGTQLVHMATERLRVIERLAACFQDGRDPQLVVHDLPSMLRQRLYGLVLGHEDLNDHDELRKDKALQASIGRLEAGRADCEPLAGKSTLNRLELAAAGTDARKARKIGVDFQQLDGLLLDLYLERHQRPPRKIVLDIDATDVPLYGEQEERFYHGYYKEYCYMPVLFLAGRQPLMVRLRSAAHDAAAGLERDLEWLLERLRKSWPRTRIIVRTDAGFCREEIMALCEGQERVDYVLGLGSNARLRAELAEEMQAAREERERTQQAARRFKDFQYRTRESWSRPRRVVGKAEALPEQGVQAAKDNQRFVVTTLPAKYFAARNLYENFYCARGNAENRVKEHKVHLFSKRCSSNLFDANTLRVYMATFALLVFRELRRALRGTRLRQALPQRVRRDLLRVGARVRVLTRRVAVSLSSSFPQREAFVRAWGRLLPAAS
jgi:hypothetical protein